jgi:Helicase conserved C-terminal domain
VTRSGATSSFEALIDKLRPDVALMLAARWDGSDSARTPAQARAYLRQIASSDAHMAKLLGRLSESMRQALCLTHWLLSEQTPSSLSAAFAAAGLVFHEPSRAEPSGAGMLAALVNLGLLGFQGFIKSDSDLYWSRTGAFAHADDDTPYLSGPLAHTIPKSGDLSILMAMPLRVDERVARLLPPLDLSRISQDALRGITQSRGAVTTAGTRHIRPQRVALDLQQLLRAIQDIGGLGLYKNNTGVIRSSDVSKLRKALDTAGTGQASIDAETPANGALEARITLLAWCGLLQYVDDDNKLIPGLTARTYARLPYAAQARALLAGHIGILWPELALADAQRVHTPDANLFHGTQDTLRASFLALLIALRGHGDGFVTLRDFVALWHARIAFTLPRPYANTSSAQPSQHWPAYLKLWADRCLSTWLYQLGLVELVFENKHVAAFCLTALGQATLGLYAGEAPSEQLAHPPVSSPASADMAADTAPRVWVVQPNFELMLFLDEATPAQLDFVLAHAELRALSDHTANFRLNRERFCAALQTGYSLNHSLDALQNGSRAPLPANVLVELRTWAAGRELITLSRTVQLIEYPTAAARDSALETLAADGQAFTALGERFIFVPEGAALKGAHRPALRIDHSDLSRTASLLVDEDGLVTIRVALTWYLAHTLSQWAQPVGENAWRLTAQSVRSALSRGLRVADLRGFLDRHSAKPIPRLLEIALAQWGRQRTRSPRATPALEQMWVFTCPNRATFEALIHSAKLLSCIWSLDPERLSISLDSKSIDRARDLLTWAGLLPTESDSG